MRTMRASLLILSFWLASASPGFAQGDLGENAQNLGSIPDLSEFFRARPPMGDCPVGATDEHGILPEGSHLLHLGVPRFYRDYRRRLKLTDAQVEQLSKDQDRALATWGSQQTAIDALEVRIWELTGAREPSFDTIETVIGELEKARTSQRLQYIRAVRAASQRLTSQQQTALVGA